ncbi:hypothetical protein TRVA0_006S03158 [Trichomonascus vanleenenianus]|uniref:Rrt5p n=1 Tax=Trichomonascus vanleenenianus TaxID=2268995 RepID=UPI003ECA7E3D
MSEAEKVPEVKKEEVQETPSAPAKASSVAKSAEEGKRVYIGNIPYKARREDISSLFEGFEVLQVTIPRSRVTKKNGESFLKKAGFAFAELPSKEEAERAVEQLNGKSLLEREVSVKLAWAIERKPKEKKPKKEGDESVASSATTAGEATTATSATTASTVQEDESAASSASSGEQKKAAKKSPAREIKRSKDTVVVSGLSSGTSDADIAALFSGLSIVKTNVKSREEQKITKRGEEIVLPAKTTAIVKFGSEEDQKKAIEEYSGKTVNGSTVAVKVAQNFARRFQRRKPQSQNGDAAAAPVVANASSDATATTAPSA